MRKRAIWQPLPKGGRGGGNIIFFLEAQFTPLSPDISIISVSQTVIFLENKNWNNRGIPRDRVLKGVSPVIRHFNIIQMSTHNMI